MFGIALTGFGEEDIVELQSLALELVFGLLQGLLDPRFMLPSIITGQVDMLNNFIEEYQSAKKYSYFFSCTSQSYYSAKATLHSDASAYSTRTVFKRSWFSRPSSPLFISRDRSTTPLYILPVLFVSCEVAHHIPSKCVPNSFRANKLRQKFRFELHLTIRHYCWWQTDCVGKCVGL